MNKRALLGVIAGMGTIGVVLAAWAFVSSLKPNDRALTSDRVIDISGLAPDHLMIIDGHESRLFVIRTLEGEIRTFQVPRSRESGIMMPNSRWWTSVGGRCLDFAPDHEKGRLLPNATFRCRDEGLPEEVAARWVWGLDGRNIASNGYRLEDLPPGQTRIKANSLVVPWNL